MKITVEVPDNAVPKLQDLVKECGAPSLEKLMRNGLALYILLHRLLGRGKLLAILNPKYDVEGYLTLEKLTHLSFDTGDEDKKTSKET